MSEFVATKEFTPSIQTFMTVMSQQARSERSRWAPKLVAPLFLLVLGLLLFGDFRSGELFSHNGILSLLSGFLVAAILFAFLWALPRVVQKYSSNRHGFTRRRYTFTADSLSLETVDGVTLKAPYRTFTKISLGPDHLVFWESLPTSAAHMIPCAEFESKEDEQTVKNWLVPFAA